MTEKLPDSPSLLSHAPDVELLTVREVAETLRVSTMTIYRLADAGLITSVRIGQSIRLSRTSVEAFLSDAEQAQIRN
jgi:excisionase family DNA binding protein